MAKKKTDEPDFQIANSAFEEAPTHVVPSNPRAAEQMEETPAASVEGKKKGVVNCLRNEKIIVRHIARPTTLVSDPRHELYGNMADGAERTFSVPRLASTGSFVNVLTNDEKDFLESIMNLEPNALSVHRRVNNFWDDSNEFGISQVTLHKRDNIFDLSKPEDYIRYKILLANRDMIAKSMREYNEHPKATYQFYIVNEGDEQREAHANMTAIQRCYKEFGKIEDKPEVLRVVVETISGRPVEAGTKIEWLQTKANELIQANSKLFLSVVTDEMLSTKVLLKQSLEIGTIASRGNHLYLRDGNTPLCEYGEEPTMAVAARYLNNPKHQDILFALQMKLQQK